MAIVLVTGSAGLIGSESVRFFCDKGYTVVGIDNNMRQLFFGEDASTEWNRSKLSQDYGDKYIHHAVDIRNHEAISDIFKTYSHDISLIIHTAAQPSHDWAAKDPYMDFSVNANGTLVLLENTRQHCPQAVFIFCSTNKVYGDRPNELPLVEKELRWEISENHPYFAQGIDELMSIDACKHSLFGASKVAADVLVQEYGRYFEMKTASFRGGCLTGPSHSGTQLHGFLSYLMKCTMIGKEYSIYGYKGKQVRDNIHSYDLVNAFYHFYQAPRVAEVYNIGGSRFSNCSMLEAIQECEAIAEKKLNWQYVETNRIGDHIWWISDVSKFKNHYPDWQLTYKVTDILKEIFSQNVSRWT
ncbi:NAD-dependent epimerase/dehydratase family protein [Microcystis aeruginosa]|uniref:NAD-dependent epimerase/dehydratase family protein n=1 Tax=Microcystis aeruginosa TaxID=1126 RepID=UPI00187EADC2|nr:NAD-dependent epimerase/dehydratase family protein [Microcystis aeruginosa]MBE8994953.1 NAD-dependent epimerase/dehydratase family protein [Microcystis aeruginosa LEGE 91341]